MVGAFVSCLKKNWAVGRNDTLTVDECMQQAQYFCRQEEIGFDAQGNEKKSILYENVYGPFED